MDINGAPPLAIQQSDPVVLDGVCSNPSGEPSTTGEAESFIIPEINEMLGSVQSFFSNHCTPRARGIETEVANLQYEINNTTERAGAEKDEALSELDRVGKLVLNFQSRISKLLRFDALGGHN